MEVGENFAQQLRDVVAKIIEYLSIKDSVREEVIKLSREIIRKSGECIRKIIRGELESANSLVMELKELVRKLNDVARSHPEIYYSGLTSSCLMEYVEAQILYRVITEGKLATPEELDVPYVPYLLGLADVVGELRRMCLDCMREGKLDKVRNYLAVMESIYLELRTIEFPEALIPGLRHKVDVCRRLIEDTKAMYVQLLHMRELVKYLEKLGSG
ncbi:MAG: haloacid dehalogenase [Thermoprotei archaeon]|nr:MAG: haloacid dehalogenase [Thermoprotei archaeon]